MTEASKVSVKSLKDKDKAWSDRLKMARCLWKSDRYIPKKEQVLIDWLGYSLQSNEISTIIDIQKAWEMMVDVIRSDPLTGQVNLKSWFSQVMMDGVVNEDTKHAAISALAALCTRQCFKSFLMISSPNLIQFLAVTLEVFSADLMEESRTELLLSIQVFTNQLDELNKLHGVSKSVLSLYSKKLLKPLLCRWHLLKQDPIGHQLQDHVFGVFFSRESLKHYDRYIREKTTPTHTHKPMDDFVDSLFSELNQMLRSTDQQERTTCIDAIPFMYNKYLYACMQALVKYNRFGFLQLLLVDLLKLPSGEKVSKDLGSRSLPVAETLECLSALLRLSNEYEMFNATLDESNTQSSLHNSLVRLLCTQDFFQAGCSSEFWFHSLHQLLNTNHSCIEKNLSLVLEHSWQKAPKMSEAASKSQSDFISALLATYSKLRQLPKFIKSLEDAIKASRKPVALPVAALQNIKHHEMILRQQNITASQCEPREDNTKFGELVTLMPATSCMQTWSQLVESLLEQIISAGSDADSSDDGVMVVAEIIYMYSKSVRLYDNATAHSVKDKLPDFITSIQKRVCDLLDKHQTLTSTVIHALLCLASCCSSVAVMVSHYVTCKPLSIPCLEYNLDQLDNQTMIARYLKMQLACLRLISIQLRHPSTGGSDLGDSVTEVFECYTEAANRRGAVCFQPWDGSFAITESNVGSAMYSLLLDTQFPFIVCSTESDDLIQMLADALLLPLLYGESSKESFAHQRLEVFMKSWAYEELQPLHSALVTSCLNLLDDKIKLSVADESSGEPKKKKKRTNVNSALQTSSASSYFQMALQCKEDDAALSEVTTKILAARPVNLTTRQLSLLQPIVTMLRSTPVDSLESKQTMVLNSLCPVLLHVLLNQEEESCNNSLIEEILHIFLSTSHTSGGSRIIGSLDGSTLLSLLFLIPIARLQAVGGFELVLRPVAKICATNPSYLESMKQSLLTIADCMSDSLDQTTDSAQLKLNLLSSITSAVFRNNSTRFPPAWLTTALSNLIANFNEQQLVDCQELCSIVTMLVSHGYCQLDNLAVINSIVSALSSLNHEMYSVDDNQARSKTSTILVLLSAVLHRLSTGTQRNPALPYRDLWTSLARLHSVSNDEVQRLMYQLLEHLTYEELFSLLYDVLLKETAGDILDVRISTLKSLLSFSGSDRKKQEVIESASKQFVVRSQLYLSDLCLSDNIALTKNLIDLLQVLADAVSRGKQYLTTQSLSSILIAMQLIKLESIPARHLFDLMTSCQQLLKRTMISHEATVANNQVALTSIANNLLRGLVHHGDQNKLCTTRDREGSLELDKLEMMLISCCQELNKVFATMATHSKVFSKPAAYLIADLLSDITLVTLLPKVKQALFLAVNPLLDICDEFGVAMLKSSLPEAQREMYKIILEQYNKYHKYTGKV